MANPWVSTVDGDVVIAMCRRLFGFVLLVFSFAALSVPRGADAQDARAGYAAIRNSVVKVWVHDAHGDIAASGTGFIVDSALGSSHIVTAAHVVKSGAKLTIDLNREIHDIPASVVATSGDVALLRIARGSLHPVNFGLGAVMVGATLAEVGFYHSDDIASQARLLYPSTVSAITDQGRVIAFDNVNIEDGLSGGPVFNATTGAVVGMVTSKRTEGSGGYAISGPVVLYYFLSDQGVNVATRASQRSTSASDNELPPEAQKTAPLRAPPTAAPAIAYVPPPPVTPAQQSVSPDAIAAALSDSFDFTGWRYTGSVHLSNCTFSAQTTMKAMHEDRVVMHVDGSWTGNLGDIDTSLVIAMGGWDVSSETGRSTWGVVFQTKGKAPLFKFKGDSFAGSPASIMFRMQADPSSVVPALRALMAQCAGSH